jgi:hypothetical protein
MDFKRRNRKHSREQATEALVGARDTGSSLVHRSARSMSAHRRQLLGVAATAIAGILAAFAGRMARRGSRSNPV